jgi:hypothetical protein
MLTHPEAIVDNFRDWLIACETDSAASDLPADGDLAMLVGAWMMDGGAAYAVDYSAFIRAVLLIVAAAAQGRVYYMAAGEARVDAVAPDNAHSWWMLEPMEFEAARRGS